MNLREAGQFIYLLHRNDLTASTRQTRNTPGFPQTHAQIQPNQLPKTLEPHQI
uniref:Uncharacterized protein n=1 Tax=Arundo donax TaxID=35708 RepID=A0A0A9FV96_ARUDO